MAVSSVVQATHEPLSQTWCIGSQAAQSALLSHSRPKAACVVHSA